MERCGEEEGEEGGEQKQRDGSPDYRQRLRRAETERCVGLESGATKQVVLGSTELAYLFIPSYEHFFLNLR